jgi:hypothetical protein
VRTQSRDPHRQRGGRILSSLTLSLPAFLGGTNNSPQKMQIRKNPGVIFICAFCRNTTRRIPICGVFSTNEGAMYPIGLCINCGPLNLELLAVCREAAVGAYRN